MTVEAAIYLSLLDRIQTMVAEMRYIEQDLGQLENYETRPAVSWPCALIDFDEFSFTDAGNHLVQIAEGIVQVRVGLVKYTDSNNLTPANIRGNGLKYLGTAAAVITALHGWAPPGCSRLLLRKAASEKRDDDIKVKILRFGINYKVDRTPALTKVARPAAVIGTDIAS